MPTGRIFAISDAPRTKFIGDVPRVAAVSIESEMYPSAKFHIEIVFGLRRLDFFFRLTMNLPQGSAVYQNYYYRFSILNNTKAPPKL